MCSAICWPALVAVGERVDDVQSKLARPSAAASHEAQLAQGPQPFYNRLTTTAKEHRGGQPAAWLATSTTQQQGHLARGAR